MYVLKKDGELVFSIRQKSPETYLPHPVLSKGEDVSVAGTIKKGSDGELLIDNHSGHFSPSNSDELTDTLDEVKRQIDEAGAYVSRVDFDELLPKK